MDGVLRLSMRIAVTGVSGFIGSEIARVLARDGHSVVGLVRETSRREHVEPHVERFVVGDHADRSAWGELLDGADAVVHNSADWRAIVSGREGDFSEHLQSNLVGSLELLKASAPRPFVFISTIAVHHDMRARWGGHIDEDHPLRPASDYGAYKAAVEAHLWAEHFGKGRHTCALRPCGVYGVDPKLERSMGYPIIEKLRDGAKGDRFDKQGGGKFVYVEDVALATLGALTHEGASGQAFNLVDCYARWADWAKLACEALGLEVGVDREIDFSSPSEPKNTFSKEAAQSIGVTLDRGEAGIRAHLEQLVKAMG